MKEQDKWRDQHGKSVTDITPEESIDLRIQEVTTKTKQTPISYQQARVVTACRNELAPLFDKIATSMARWWLGGGDKHRFSNRADRPLAGGHHACREVFLETHGRREALPG
jgi:hypothetical protein